jgi:hypothetical protein
MRKLYTSILFIGCILTTGCTRDIELDLPEYKPKMVLEFYLENNRPLHCLLQESIPFTDTAQFKLIDQALVVLSYGGIKDTLINTIYVDTFYQKIYNYYNNKTIQLQPNLDYELYVKDAQGRELTGKTRLIQEVPIDTLVYNYNSDNKAAAGLVFTDDGTTKDYYRIVAFNGSPGENSDDLWDITFTDVLFNGSQFSFYTGYSFDPGDTITGRLYHLTEEHYNFAQSVNNAQSSNGNPFGQPANIVTNLTGGIGIFTTLIHSEKKVIVQ